MGTFKDNFFSVFLAGSNQSCNYPTPHLKETSPEQAQPSVEVTPNFRKQLLDQKLPFLGGRKQNSWRHSSNSCRKQRNGAESWGNIDCCISKMLFGLTIPFLHERGFAAQAPEGAGLPLTDQAIIFPDKKTMPDNFLLLNLLFLKPSASAGAFL